MDATWPHVCDKGLFLGSFFKVFFYVQHMGQHSSNLRVSWDVKSTKKLNFFDSQVKFQVGIKNHRNLEPSDCRKSSSRSSGVPNFAKVGGAKNEAKWSQLGGMLGPKSVQT